MAKDPALLFYTSDFLVGTMTMSDEQVGKYIRLLCLQHQKGILTEKDMSNICQTYDKDIYEKFKKNGDNTFYNERLKEEADRRKEYSKSRRDNRNGSKGKKNHMSNISKSYVKHMETETETETINKNKEDFEKTRNLYPNTKRGLDTEFDYFRKTHKDWKEVLPTLETALKNQIEQRKKMTGFVPEWKHFKSWIYNRSWEEQKESKETQTYKIPSLN